MADTKKRALRSRGDDEDRERIRRELSRLAKDMDRSRKRRRKLSEPSGPLKIQTASS